MNSPQCTLRVRQRNGGVTVRVEGRATMNQSPAVRRYAEKCFSQGVQSLRLDLQDCSYMDSTFLGTLLQLQRSARRQGKREFTLVQPSECCVQVLEQAGLKDVIPVGTPDAADELSWLILPEEPEDKGALKDLVVAAHKELAALPGKAGEAFRTVADCLEAEIAARR